MPERFWQVLPDKKRKLLMSSRVVNGLMFILAGITPIVVYLGLGPDGAGILSMARTEQVFAYLFFSLPIAFMMLRKDETNNCSKQKYDNDFSCSIIGY